MATCDIPRYPIKRLRYFNNQFLKDQDFIDDTSHQIGCERALLRSLCVVGVCEGLSVSYPATNAPPSVSAGIAIDKSGQMIVLDQPTNGIASPAALADGDYFVHISFLESEDDKAAGQGASDYTRWTQTPVITATAKTAALPDGAVVLGSCTVKTGLFVGSGTTIGRQYSGLRLPGPNQSTTAALRNNGASNDLAVLGVSLTIRRDAGGQLGPTLTLLNGAGAAGAGGAIDFNGSDPGTNDPTLRLRYYVTSGETTKLMLGINNDSDDSLGLWQAGGERITLSSSNIYMNATTYFSGYYGSASDLELKQNIRPLDGLLAGLMRLRPVRFTWIRDNTEDLGFIAQELEAVFPEAVFTVPQQEASDRPVKALSAHHLAVLALAALRELKQEVDGRLDAVELALATPGRKPSGGKP